MSAKKKQKVKKLWVNHERKAPGPTYDTVRGIQKLVSFSAPWGDTLHPTINILRFLREDEGPKIHAWVAR